MTTTRCAWRPALSLTVLGFALTLVACGNMGASMPTATVTASPSASPSPTPTETPSSTPTVTATAGPSPTPAPTPVFGSARVGNDFLFGNQPEGCELPCWQGLIIGQSDAGDIQATLDTAFGFNGSHDFFRDIKEYEIPNLLATFFRWDFDVALPPDKDPGLFNIFVLVHKDTRLLEAIGFAGVSTRFNEDTNPQHVLRELGTPSMMWVRMGGSEDAHEGMATLTLVYERGIAIYYEEIRAQYDDNNVGKLCLGRPKTNYFQVQAYLTGPIPDNLNEFSPLEYSLFGWLITSSEYTRTFEEVFEISLEEITEMAQQPGDLCVYAEMPW